MKQPLAAVVLAFASFSCVVSASAQSEPPADRAPEPLDSHEKKQEGITREQADEILTGLRAIHRLLALQEQRIEAMQTRMGQTPGAGVSEKVNLSLTDAEEWYSQGKDDATVTIVEFTDYQYPYCKRFAQTTFAEIKKKLCGDGQGTFLDA